MQENRYRFLPCYDHVKRNGQCWLPQLLIQPWIPQ
jgi:hypothetical protein